MTTRLRVLAIAAAAVVLYLAASWPATQPGAGDGGPWPDAEQLTGRQVDGVPISVAGGVPAVAADPQVTVAVSPWVAWRFGSAVLRDAEQVFTVDGARLQVRYVVRAHPTRSTFAVTSSGFQVGECALTHGFARSTAGGPIDDRGQQIRPVTSGRVRICGNTYRWPHRFQVALLAHETAHLLGLGHVCEGDACLTAREDGQASGCAHLMAGMFSFDCPVDLSSLDEVWRTLYPSARDG